MKNVASLIYFPEGITKEEAEEYIRRLNKALEKELGTGVGAITKEYDPDWGSPVWYIP